MLFVLTFKFVVQFSYAVIFAVYIIHNCNCAGTMMSLAVLATGFQLAAFKSPDITNQPDLIMSYPQCANYT